MLLQHVTAWTYTATHIRCRNIRLLSFSKAAMTEAFMHPCTCRQTHIDEVPVSLLVRLWTSDTCKSISNTHTILCAWPHTPCLPWVAVEFPQEKDLLHTCQCVCTYLRLCVVAKQWWDLRLLPDVVYQVLKELKIYTPAPVHLHRLSVSCINSFK